VRIHARPPTAAGPQGAAGVAGPIGAAGLVAMVPTVDVTVAAHYALVGSGIYELQAGITLELAADATLEIG
jgi:hypothetical protein